VEQQGNLSVAGDDAGALQKPEQFPQLTTLVMGRLPDIAMTDG
jgi:hypothetical protein